MMVSVNKFVLYPTGIYCCQYCTCGRPSSPCQNYIMRWVPGEARKIDSDILPILPLILRGMKSGKLGFSHFWIALVSKWSDISEMRNKTRKALMIVLCRDGESLLFCGMPTLAPKNLDSNSGPKIRLDSDSRTCKRCIIVYKQSFSCKTNCTEVK